MAKNRAALKEVEVSLNTGFLSVAGTWSADASEREAAWEMYVELITRVSVEPLADDEGLMREALTSLYKLFQETREILKKHGPGVAVPKGKGMLSFGYLAVAILNQAIRPFLAKWHPLLQQHEAGRGANVPAVEHERAWVQDAAMRRELGALRETLRGYSYVLAKAAGIEPIQATRGRAGK